LNKTKNGGGLHIDRAYAFDDGNLGIILSNGNFIVIELEFILDLPGFDVLWKNKDFMNPQKSEDGRAVCWQGAPRPVGLDEILELMAKTENA
jgi:hypothetical protein